MNTITHDPTRGWLLLTPDGQIEIDPKDWAALIDLFKTEDSESPPNHYPRSHSVDAEFEVREQWKFCLDSQWRDIEIGKSKDDCGPGEEYRKIARLVKAGTDEVKKRFRISRI